MVHFELKRKEVIKKLYEYKAGQVSFVELAKDLFAFQSENNVTYRKFLNYIKFSQTFPESLSEFPFLPVEVFKKNQVMTGNWQPQVVFQSSGTTQSSRSMHFVRDVGHYSVNAAYCFTNFFGDISNFRFYGLLPSYLEQDASSLVHMVNQFMQINPEAKGGFYTHETEQLVSDINAFHGRKTQVLFGVSYALLDLAEKLKPDLNGVIVIETGGMKGRGKELAREELHQILCSGFNVQSIHSEYGMTELLSQAYSGGQGIFKIPPTLAIVITDIYDPKQILGIGQQGRINIIDLANIDSCAFIATEDIGVKISENQFTVLGRTDASDIRGCNLLYV